MRRWCVSGLLAILFLGIATHVQAQTARLVWDPVPDSAVAGYVVMYGRESGRYTTTVDVGAVSEWPLPDSLHPAYTHFFVVLAYTEDGLRSLPSDEVYLPPAAPTILGPSYNIFFQHADTNELAIWNMSGNRQVGGGSLGPGSVPAGWHMAGSADFNRDGRSDLAWQHDDGTLAVWFMDGGRMLSGELVTPALIGDLDWRIVAVADMNRDGWPDFVWRHRTQGLLSVWTMRGTHMLEGHLLTPDKVPDLNWTVVGAGDFNLDGHSDLVWHNRADGRLSVWIMQGSTLIDGRAMTPDAVADTGWQIRGVRDINGDRWPDLLWQHTNGSLSVWLMTGSTMRSGGALMPLKVTGWQMLAVR
ncbi:MAG TPA: FG-GAP-like repeat-containing protein [Vicinamibacterales bacterium]|nr:FG-GAP-like repeat-containing protein [Vicinamibacterales bacterium]